MKATIEAGYVEIDGVRTYFERCGRGRPMLCLHTAGRDCRQYQWLMQELADEFCVVSFDYPGHGKSWPLPGNRCVESAEAFCEFIWKVAQRFEMGKPLIAGCSVGGNLALMMGARHADELLAIVPMQAADYSPSISKTTLQLMQHPHVSLPYFNLEQSTSLVGRAAPEEVRAFVEWTAYQLSGSTLVPDLTLYTDLDLRDQMDRVTCPVLMIRGEDDWIVPQELVDGTISRLVNARRVELLGLPGIGHYAPMEAPRAVALAIRRFVAAVS